MAEIRSDMSGPTSIQQTAQITGIMGPKVATPDGSTDVIESSQGTKIKKTADAVSPELMQALFLMWFTGGSTPIFLQQLGGNAAGSVGAIGANQANKPIDMGLFKLQVENKLNEICIGVLNAWGKSIHEQGEAIKREMKSDAYKEWEARHGHEGYNKWLLTLSPEQRLQAEEYPIYDKLIKIDEGTRVGLSDYLAQIKTSTDPKVSQDLPFITAALVIGGSLRTDYVGMVDTVSNQILITPILEANNHAIQQAAPQDQAIVLGYLGALMLSGASYHALGQTLPIGATDKKVIDRTFAENYAKKVLEIVDGQGLQSIAMALISQSIEPGQHVSEERKVQLFKDVQVVLLSSALALVYKTETSVSKDGEVYGGGIRSEEFVAMVNGNDKLLDTTLKQNMATKIRVLLEENPDKDAILASIGSFIDQHTDSKSLLNIEGLFANITLDKGPNPMVVGG